MMIDLAETTTDRIHEAIRQARQRLGGPASGMVLTLVIVTDEAAQYDAVRSASEAAREHPMRVLAVITGGPRPDPGWTRRSGSASRDRARWCCSGCTARWASTPTRWSPRC